MTRETRGIMQVTGILLFAQLAHAQPPRCVQETIQIHVCGAYCLFQETYAFRNDKSSPAAWSLFYPLTSTSDQPFPDSIHVENVDTKSEVPFGHTNKGISFLVNTPPVHTSLYSISYRQRTPSFSLDHAVTAPGNKGKPLERATFVIIIPDSLRLTNISLRFDGVEKRRDERVYSIVRKNFHPDKNLIIHWEKKK